MATPQLRYSSAGRREQILEVALRLFARRGFEGTTTRQIAAGARVNEAIIFRHFPRKEDLYWAVLERECERQGGTQAFRRKLASGRGNDGEVLSGIARDILDRRSRDVSLSRLLLFSALENHRLSQRFFRTYLAEYYEVLADHIRAGIAAGQFRAVDPMLAARGFFGMMVYHSWVQELFGWKRLQAFDNAEVARTLTDIWLAGMLPGSASGNGASRPGGLRAGAKRKGKQNGSERAK
jgi:AcrR family transcriptional regulator